MGVFLSFRQGKFFRDFPDFLHRLTGVRELRQRVRPFRAESFSLNLSGGSPSADGGNDAVPTAVGKKEGQPAVFLPL